MTKHTDQDLLAAVDGLDPSDLDLFVEVLRTARALKDLDPGFLQRCSERAAAHVDAGGTDPAAVVRPILAEAQARLARP